MIRGGGGWRAASLAAFLFAFWLLLSGHYSTWLVVSGAVAAIGVALLGMRMGVVDAEGHAVARLPAALTYGPWLVFEMLKSSVAVAGVILRPALPISPTMVRLPSPLRTPLGVATYANSITFTPGTITVEADHGDAGILVHALTEAGAESLGDGGMLRRVARFEGQG